MKKTLYAILSFLLIGVTACDVHEWPDLPEKVSIHLRLNYETDMTIWEHQYDGESTTETGLGETYDNHLQQGKIRYIIRTYPISEEQRTLKDYTQEFVFTKDIAEGYDHEITLDLLPGDYRMMVWSDLTMDGNRSSYYNSNDFGEISLQGEHIGNDNYRDAFYGKSSLSLHPSVINQAPDTISITMKRPLAKFEIVTQNLSDFIDTKTNDIHQYKAKIQYVGFMPNAYSLYTDKPVDSTVGVMFESPLKELASSKVSMGFDYVFVSDRESVVTVKIGIYDKDDTPIASTESIKVPLQPSHHTILTGDFLQQYASGGVDLNPAYDGNYNLIIP